MFYFPLQKALRLLLSGEIIDANKGLAMGLYDHILSPLVLEPRGRGRYFPTPLKETVTWLTEIIGRQTSTDNVHAIKRVVNEAAFPAVEGSLEAERQLLAERWGSDEHVKMVRTYYTNKAPIVFGKMRGR